MTYKKPSNVTYTDMAIYIDGHIYLENCDQNLCFEYLYHLFYMVACKGRYFNSARDYDEYALYGASQLFLRYQNKKQFVNEKDEQLPKIKSCLNYIKKIAYPLKINYQNNTFAQTFSADSGEENIGELTATLTTQATRTNQHLLKADFEYFLSRITQSVRYFLKDLPYHKDPVIMHNIYISCILTLLKSVTLSNRNIARLRNKENRKLPTDDLLDSIYKEEMSDSVVVYHLDPSLENYIATLVNRAKKQIAKDLRYIIGYYEPSDQMVKSILASPMEDYGDEN